MNWLKVHHGMPSDPLWAVIAKRASVPRHAVVAVWCALLDHASQNNPRGSLVGLDAEMIGVSLDLETQQVEAVVTALTERGKIVSNSVANWVKRQTGTSTERVKRFRERNSTDGNANETQNETPAPLRNGDETIEKRREEQIREDSLAATVVAPASQPAKQDFGDPELLAIPKTLKRKSRLEGEFLIEEDGERYRYAKQLGMTDADLDIECDKFENHHRAKGSLMADWDAAWRTWCRNWQTFSQKRRA